MVTAAPTTKVVGRSKAGKYGFYSPNEGHIIWKFEKDLTTEERAWCELPRIDLIDRYGDDIQFAMEMAEGADERAKYAQRIDRYRLQSEAYQWRLYAEMMREAELVEEKPDVSFGYAPHWGGVFAVPPDVQGYKRESIKFYRHVLRTSDPLIIAILRRHLREKSNPNLVELSADKELVSMYGKEGVHRLAAVVSAETGFLTGWLPSEAVEKMYENGMVKI